MSKTLKNKIISVLSVCLLACLVAFGVSLAPKKAMAAENTISAITGMAETDYQFGGYSLRYDNATTFESQTSGVSALRFKTQITPKFYAFLVSEGATTGTLVMPAHYVADELTVNTVGDSGEKPIDIDTTNSFKFVKADANYQAVAYLNEIPKDFYGTKVLVRGYALVDGVYYYTTATEAKSIADIAQAEQTAENFDTDTKSAIKESLLKFNIIVNDVSIDTAYYGENYIFEVDSVPGKVITGYTSLDGSLEWTSESLVLGNVNLKAGEVDAKQYYSKAKKSATFDMVGADSAVVKATVNGQEVDCVIAEDKITLGDLTTLGLVEGGTYVLTAGEKKIGFTYVTDVNDYIPYASGDVLHVGANAVTSVTGLNGETVATAGVLTGVSENKSTTVVNGSEYLATTVDGVYKITTKIFTDVLYTNADAIAFFIGTQAGADGTIGTDDDYNDSTIVKGAGTASYAIATDLDLGIKPLLDGANGNFSALFDGCGHTLKWTIDESVYTFVDQDSTNSWLFRYYFHGILQNIELDVNFQNLSNTGSRYYLLGKFFYSAKSNVATQAIVRNVFVDLNFDKTIDYKNTVVALGGEIKDSQCLTLQDVLMVRDFGKNAFNISSRTLFYSAANIPGIGDSEYSATVEGSGKTVDTTQFIFSNVNIITPDNIESTLYVVTSSNYGFAENQDFGKSGITNFTNYRKTIGTALYNYSNAKETVTKVGNWVINYGTSIKDTTATFVR